MRILRLTAQHPYLTSIQLWYEQAFPVDERRDFTQLLAILDCPDLHVCALLEQEQPVGFIIYWQWDDLTYIEHFAIDPQQRGRQLGQKALQLLLTSETDYFVLEVELPTDDLSRRRVQFYERQGFVLNAFDYVQPPYWLNGTAVPMKLMLRPALPDPEIVRSISKRIKENVYQRFY